MSNTNEKSANTTEKSVNTTEYDTVTERINNFSSLAFTPKFFDGLEELFNNNIDVLIKAAPHISNVVDTIKINSLSYPTIHPYDDEKIVESKIREEINKALSYFREHENYFKNLFNNKLNRIMFFALEDGEVVPHFKTFDLAGLFKNYCKGYYNDVIPNFSDFISPENKDKITNIINQFDKLSINGFLKSYLSCMNQIIYNNSSNYIDGKPVDDVFDVYDFDWEKDDNFRTNSFSSFKKYCSIFDFTEESQNGLSKIDELSLGEIKKIIYNYNEILQSEYFEVSFISTQILLKYLFIINFEQVLKSTIYNKYIRRKDKKLGGIGVIINDKVNISDVNKIYDSYSNNSMNRDIKALRALYNTVIDGVIGRKEDSPKWGKDIINIFYSNNIGIFQYKYNNGILQYNNEILQHEYYNTIFYSIETFISSKIDDVIEILYGSDWSWLFK